MSRQTIRWVACLQIGLLLLTGCHPIQPFYARNNPSLANYMDQAMSIEYADVQVESLPEATQSLEPYAHDRMPTEFHDWTLEDCTSIALQNTKMIRAVSGINLQSGSVAGALLSAQPGQLPSVYDPALVANVGNTQPLVVDSQGTRVAPRGSVRANQVGGVEHALSEFDTQFSTVLGYNTTDRPRNVGQGNVFNPQFFRATDSNFQAALSKRMATGTVATARMTTVYSRNNIPASGNNPASPNFGRSVPSDYTAALELQLNQPLMRGRGTLVNRIPVVLARINEDIALHQFEATIRNLLRDVEHAYWDLYMGYRAVEAARTARDSALDLWRVAKERAAISDTTPAAVAQAAGRVAQFQAALNIAINGSPVPGNDPLGLVGRERVLREKMGLAPTDGPFIRPSEEPTLARIAFDWEEVKAEGLVRNTELRTQKWSIKQRELEVMSAKNQILPQLDLVGAYRWLGVGDELIGADRNGIRFPDPGSRAFEELTNGDFQEVSARIEFTPAPLGSRREKINVLASQMQLKKSHEELRTKELMLVHQMETAWVTVASTHTSMMNFFDQLRENQSEIDIYHEQIANDSGDMSQILDFLLRAEEIKARAQLQYFQSIVEYNKAIVNIHYLKGSLFDLNNVTLGEGAWVEKAYWDAEQRSRERAGGHYFDYGYTRPAVVSNGPVEQGGVAEGNVSDAGITMPPSNPSPSQPAKEPEEVPAAPVPESNGDSQEVAPEASPETP
ncbi:MAG TPA: transporter [Planctomycetaceae bacterium]|nr:transporter [Planctomycetaceae bacterium]